jgi:hypothetical protein
VGVEKLGRRFVTFFSPRLNFCELEPYLPELLTWLQDINWPIFPSVENLLRSLGGQVVPAVKAALSEAKKADDAIWAENIMNAVVKPLGQEQMAQFGSEFRSWWFSDHSEIKILIFGLLAEHRMGDLSELKKWVTINRKADEVYAEELRAIERELEVGE